MVMPTRNEPSDHGIGHREPLEIPRGLCRRCVRAVSRRLRDLPGISTFEIDAAGGRVWISGEVDRAAAEDALRNLNCS
jgi:hypothetical protein